MYVNIKEEFEDFRLILTSNEMSSTLYVEQLPKYTGNERIRVFALYFYGNTELNVRRSWDQISEKGRFCDYFGLKNLMMDYCKNREECSGYSYSEKEVSCFDVKPKDGFYLKITGTDFIGRSAWDYFIFSDRKGRFLISKDSGSSKKLFKEQTINCFLSGKSYKNLINRLKDINCKFEEVKWMTTKS